MKLYSKTCPECGLQFDTHKSNKRFDTDKCRIDYNNRKIYSVIKDKVTKSEKLYVSKSAIAFFIRELALEKYSKGDRQNEYLKELTDRFNEIIRKIE